MYFTMTWLLCLRRQDPPTPPLDESGRRLCLAPSCATVRPGIQLSCYPSPQTAACRISFGWFKCVITTIAHRCHCLFTQLPLPTLFTLQRHRHFYRTFSLTTMLGLRPRLLQFPVYWILNPAFFAIFMAVWAGARFLRCRATLYVHTSTRILVYTPRALTQGNCLSWRTVINAFGDESIPGHGMHRLWQTSKVLIGNIYIAVVCNWRQLLGLSYLKTGLGAEVSSLAWRFGYPSMSGI